MRNEKLFGTYDKENNHVLIKKSFGPHFKTMGRFIKGNEVLYPEEALYLVEKGALLISNYSEMIQEKFTAYDSLKSHGFTVLKCRPVKKLIEKYVELTLPSITRMYYRLLKLQVDKAVVYSYDVFKPTRDFKKSRPGNSDFKVCIYEADSRLTCIQDLINFKVAVVDQDQVVFLTVLNG